MIFMLQFLLVWSAVSVASVGVFSFFRYLARRDVW